MGSPFYHSSGFQSNSTPSDAHHSEVRNLQSAIKKGIDDSMLQEVEEEEGEDEKHVTPTEENTDTKIQKNTDPENDSIKHMDDSILVYRSLRFQKLNTDVSLTDVLTLIQLGPIENCYYEDDQLNHSVVVTFVDPFTLSKSFGQLTEMLDDLKKLLNSDNLTILKFNSNPISNFLKTEIVNNGASRSLCLSNLPLHLSQSIIIDELSKFGTLSLVQYNMNKNSCFIDFTSILDAIKCLNQLPLSDSILSNAKIFYSSDGNSFNIPCFSSTNSFLDTFSDINDFNSLKKNVQYSETPTTLSSRRPSYEFTNTFNNHTNRRHKSNNFSFQHHPPSTSNNLLIFHNDSNVDLNMSNLHNANNKNNNNTDDSGKNNVIDTNEVNVAGNVDRNNNNSSEHNYTSSAENAEDDSYSYRDEFAESNLDMSLMYLPNNLSFLNSIPNNINNRTVYLGNLSFHTTIEDLCNSIRGGALENIKLYPEKRVAFISFINHYDASNFIANSTKEHLYINSKLIKVAWGKYSGELNPFIKLSYDNGATRNLYIGIDPNLEATYDYDLYSAEAKELINSSETGKLKDSDPAKFRKVYKVIPCEEILRRDFSIFGEIEQINYFKDNACAFINFTNIAACIKAVEDFNNDHSGILNDSLDNRYKDLIISYGKDRCANPPKKKRSKKKTKLKQKFKNFNGIMLNEKLNYSTDNNSIDTDLALQFNSAFEDIGISSPSTKKKSEKNNSNLSKISSVLYSKFELNSKDSLTDEINPLNGNQLEYKAAETEEQHNSCDGEDINVYCGNGDEEEKAREIITATPAQVESKNGYPDDEAEAEEVEEDEEDEIDIITDPVDLKSRSHSKHDNQKNRFYQNNNESYTSRKYKSKSFSTTSVNNPYHKNYNNNRGYSTQFYNYSYDDSFRTCQLQGYYYPSPHIQPSSQDQYTPIYFQAIPPTHMGAYQPAYMIQPPPNYSPHFGKFDQHYNSYSSDTNDTYTNTNFNTNYRNKSTSHKTRRRLYHSNNSSFVNS